MLKFIHVARISNFHTFLTNFSTNFKHIVLSRLDKLLVLQYMVENLEMYSFQTNLNCSKISLVALDMSQTVHEGLV
jgi:hypothetical protein